MPKKNSKELPKEKIWNYLELLTEQILKEEQDLSYSKNYTKNIYKVLKDDPNCGYGIPIDVNSPYYLYNKLRDNLILCKLINLGEPDTIKVSDFK